MRIAAILVVIGAIGVGVAAAPAVASAASATVTGDDGNPQLLSPGVPLGIRNMDVEATVTVSPAEAPSWKSQVIGPDGVPAAPLHSCRDGGRYRQSWTHHPSYRGNGAYVLVVDLYADTRCATPQGSARFAYVINAGVALTAPPGALLTRPPNEVAVLRHRLGLIQNPGAGSYEVRFARGGVAGPDGAIAGPSRAAFANLTTGTVDIGFEQPGPYTIVVRAKAGDYFTPWSPPLQVKALAPFDLERTTFTDRRGPSYRVRGVMREKAARGRVTIAVARGRRGGRFRTLGRARVRRGGVVSLRFRLRRRGTYRLRFSYSGSDIVARGTSTQTIRITRRLR